MQTATEDSKHPEPALKRPLTPPVKQCKQPVTESEERKQPALALKRLQPPPAKRCKSPATESKDSKNQAPASKREAATAPVSAPVSDDGSTVLSRFVRDTLWELTTVLDVSDDKRRALLASLDNRNEQSHAALALYAEEGGLGELSRTLLKWATGEGESCTLSKVNSVLLPTAEKTEVNLVWPLQTLLEHLEQDHRATNICSIFCQGRSIISPKCSKVKAPCKLSIIDLTSDEVSDDDEEKEEQEEETKGLMSRRLRFGLTSTILFRPLESIDKFRLRIRRKKDRKLPKQNFEASISAVKPS